MSTGALSDNVLRFARLLRGAGVPVGPDRVVVALRALAAVDVTERQEFHAALHASLIGRREHTALFDDAFALFWRDPGGLDPALAALLPRLDPPPGRDPRVPSRRLLEAWASRHVPQEPSPDERSEATVALSWSDREVSRHRDFDEMSASELRRAEVLVARMRMPAADRRTRRFRRSPRPDRIDLRASVRAALGSAGRDLPLRWRRRRRRPVPWVLLVDVSGSMDRYSRVFLHFAHALVRARRDVEVFLFGTRLSRATRQLRERDPDVALRALGASVSDWSGGTRIGACLREFDRRWSRRVLGRRAGVLLLTDGLDRGDPDELERAAERFRRSCTRWIWLNPLLRYSGFEPRARGVRTLLPFVDLLLPIHDLSSLEELVKVLDEASENRDLPRIPRDSTGAAEHS